MRTINIKILLATFLTLFATVAQAQENTGGWSGQATLYGWLPAIQGSQKRQNGSPVVDLGSSSVLDALQGAFFGSIEVRKGKFGVGLDIVFADLGHKGTATGSFIPGANPASAEIGTTLFVGAGIVSYRFYEQNDSWVDG